jgi:hypothetical protein
MCRAVDEIVMVVETDAASIQASQHLASVLYEAGLGRKIAGFLLNKAMDDPSALAATGRSLFRCEYLGAIPLDIETTRRFIKGMMPEWQSLFSRHASRILSGLLPEADALKNRRILSASEFGTIGLSNPDTRFGNYVIAGLVLYVALGYVAFEFGIKGAPFHWQDVWPVLGACLGVLLSLSDQFKQVLGHLARSQQAIVEAIIRRLFIHG